MKVDEVTEQIIGAAIQVHRALGPGLLESAYEACRVHELAERGLSVERRKALPVTYGGAHIECGYRIDLLVEREVIVELKGRRSPAAGPRGEPSVWSDTCSRSPWVQSPAILEA